MNTFGRLYRLTTFGESHGPVIGGVIDGCPPGLQLDIEFIQSELDKRRPGTSHLTSARKEPDRVEFLSGIFEGKTTGTPIAFIIRNRDHRSADYEAIKDIFRPSHGDYTYQVKYGIRDWRGGGRYSARETAARVVAGAIAKQILSRYGVKVYAYVSQIGPVVLDKSYNELDLEKTYQSPVRCPDPAVSQKMSDFLSSVKKQGDTTGGVITGIITGLPAGLGEPLYDKFHARLAYAMLSINAAKGFDIGSGFDGAKMKGSEHNDSFYTDRSGRIRTETNNAGGVLAGITTGGDVYFRVAFKPVSTIFKPQRTVTVTGERVEFTARGRHDACPVPRAVPVVEAMAAMVTLDFLLINKGLWQD